jgi:hypothetical protein
MTPAEIIALVAACGGLVVAMGTATASVVTALRMGRVEKAVDGHTTVIQQLAGSEGFSRGVAAQRAVSSPDEPVATDPLQVVSDLGRLDRHGNLLGGQTRHP